MTDSGDPPQSRVGPAAAFNPGTGTGHVIVCGLSNLGLRIAEQFHDARVPVVVVDDGGEPAAWRQLHRWSVPVVRESSLSVASLAQAGIAQAAAVIAAHDADLSNLETALLVADLADSDKVPRLVVRLANPRLATQLNAALPSAVVLSLPEKAGSSFVEGCIQSSLLHAFAFADERLEVIDVQAAAGGQTTLRRAFGDLTSLAL
jgi:Trk K+ transport system NAD-binding subunit